MKKTKRRGKSFVALIRNNFRLLRFLLNLIKEKCGQRWIEMSLARMLRLDRCELIVEIHFEYLPSIECNENSVLEGTVSSSVEEFSVKRSASSSTSIPQSLIDHSLIAPQSSSTNHWKRSSNSSSFLALPQRKLHRVYPQNNCALRLHSISNFASEQLWSASWEKLFFRWFLLRLFCLWMKRVFVAYGRCNWRSCKWNYWIALNLSKERSDKFKFVYGGRSWC